MKKIIAATAFALCSTIAFGQEVIGSVNSAFHIFGSDKIVIEAFDDPKVAGVTCYLSNAQKGGLSGAVGLAEDPSEASIACRAVGNTPARIVTQFAQGEDVFTQARSPLFKRMRVVRFYDSKRNVVNYLSYTDKLVDGSPKNSLSVVPLGK